MVEEKKELPNVEEPTAEVKVETDVDGLMAELERAGVTNTEDLSGKLRAGSEAGNLARLLGDERKEKQGLQEKVDRLQAKPQPQQDFMEYPEGQTIDIESAIERSVNKTLDKRDKVAREANQRSLAAWNRIQTDEDYHLVKDIWEERLKDPAFVMQIQSGAKNPVDEYTSTLRTFYKTLLKKSHETITTMKGDDLKPPHVETGAQVPSNIVGEGDKDVSAERRFLDEIGKKIAKGYLPTEDEEALIAEATIKAGIPT